MLTAMGMVSVDLKDAREAMEIILNENAEEYGLSEKHRKSWIEIMALRLRNVVHDFGLAKRAGSTWLEHGFSSECLDEDSSVVCAGDVANVIHEYGYNSNLRLAWRKKFGTAVAEREFSLAVVDNCDADENEPVQAEFHDGSSCTINVVTYGALRSMKISDGRSTCECVVWESAHKSTHNGVWLSQKKDRALLLIAYEQGKQIVQVRVSLFGNLKEPQPNLVPVTDETLQKAIRFMKSICVDFCSDVMKDKLEM